MREGPESGTRAPGPPQSLLAADVGGAGEDEEKIGETVEIDRDERVHAFDHERGALGAPAHGTRDEQQRGLLGAAGKDEALQRLQALVRVVDLALEPVDRVLLDAQPLVSGVERDGEVGAEVEQLVLDALDLRIGHEQAEQRVELVDVPHGGDPGVGLLHARSVAQAGLASVAAARVDASQSYGFVWSPRHAPRLRLMIRRARAADAAEISRVFTAARDEMTYLPRIDDDVRPKLGGWFVERWPTWVAEHEGQVAAFLCLRGEWVEQLYVEPEAQGRGLGSELLELAKRESRHRLELWVFQQNEGARRFYERRGFRLVELTDGSANMERAPDARYEWTSGS